MQSKNIKNNKVIIHIIIILLIENYIKYFINKFFKYFIFVVKGDPPDF